jgi:hypothetical protein
VADPLNPAAWNRFGYAYGNPVNLRDPSGHCVLCFVAIGASLFAMGGAVYYSATHPGASFDRWDYLAAVGGAGVTGAAVGYGVYLAPAAVGYGMSAAGMDAIGTAVWLNRLGVSATSLYGLMNAGQSAYEMGYFLQLSGWAGARGMLKWGKALSDGGELSPYQIQWDPKSPGRPDPRWSIDTRIFTSGEMTANGGIRNRAAFWSEWLKRNPSTLSEANRYRIEELDLSPKIDQAWIKYYPEHSSYLKEILIHHHVNQGPFAIPVPSSTHVGFGGVWHTQ